MSDLFNLVLPDVYRFIVVRGLFDVNAVSRAASATILTIRRGEVYGVLMCLCCRVLHGTDTSTVFCYSSAWRPMVYAHHHVEASLLALPVDEWFDWCAHSDSSFLMRCWELKDGPIRNPRQCRLAHLDFGIVVEEPE